MDTETRGVDIATMPRGGFDASCLDRLLETDRSEYLDRADVDFHVKRQVIDALNWVGRVFKKHEQVTGIALDLLADTADPKILELGAGHGAVSRLLMENHPTAEVTVADINPVSVADIAAGDDSFDLALFALSFHHLAPEQASRVFAEGTRVARQLLIVDLPRPPAPLHLLRLASMLPLAPFVPFVHDGVISSLRSYSPSALRTLAQHADPTITVELHGGLISPQIVVASRARDTQG